MSSGAASGDSGQNPFATRFYKPFEVGQHLGQKFFQGMHLL